MKKIILLALLLAGCKAPVAHFSQVKSPIPLPPSPMAMTPTGRAPKAALVAAPPVPPEICIAGTGPTNIILVWDASASPGVDGYNVYWGTKSRSYTNNCHVSGTSCELEGLQAPTNFCYFFTVTATREYLESPYDGEAAIGTQIVTVKAQGDGGTNLAQWVRSFWYPSPKQEFFRLRVSGDVLTLQERDLIGTWWDIKEPQTNAAALSSKSFRLTISR